jgi:hypothetical protein
MWGKKKNARSPAQETTKNWKKDSGQSIDNFKSKAKKKQTPPKNNVAVSELSISSSYSSSHPEQKLQRNKEPDHNTNRRPPQPPKKKEGKSKKTMIKFCLEKSLCFSHGQRRQNHQKRSKEGCVALRSG